MTAVPCEEPDPEAAQWSPRLEFPYEFLRRETRQRDDDVTVTVIVIRRPDGREAKVELHGLVSIPQKYVRYYEGDIIKTRVIFHHSKTYGEAIGGASLLINDPMLYPL